MKRRIVALPGKNKLLEEPPMVEMMEKDARLHYLHRLLMLFPTDVWHGSQSCGEDLGSVDENGWLSCMINGQSRT